MNVSYIETTREASDALEAAEAALTQAGIGYEVACTGPEPFCSDLLPVAAA